MGANIDKFNQVVGLIFDQLYRAFPVAVDLDYETFAEKLAIEARDYRPPSNMITTRTRIYGDIVENTNMETFIDEAASFLVVEGFLQRDGHNYRLSARALTILNAPITGLDHSLGAKLTSAVKDVGTETGKAAISETVGQIIGATFRGMLGSG